MRIVVDYDECEANGVCESLAPNLFELDEADNLHVLAHPDEDSLAQARAAVQACPKAALSLEE